MLPACQVTTSLSTEKKGCSQRFRGLRSGGFETTSLSPATKIITCTHFQIKCQPPLRKPRVSSSKIFSVYAFVFVVKRLVRKKNIVIASDNTKKEQKNNIVIGRDNPKKEQIKNIAMTSENTKK